MNLLFTIHNHILYLSRLSHTSIAFYLIVDDLKFWLETIRCYGTDRVSDEDESHKDPSVFIVGTHRDKFEVIVGTSGFKQLKFKLQKRCSTLSRVKNCIGNVL